METNPINTQTVYAHTHTLRQHIAMCDVQKRARRARKGPRSRARVLERSGESGSAANVRPPSASRSAKRTHKVLYATTAAQQHARAHKLAGVCVCVCVVQVSRTAQVAQKKK